MQWRAGSWLLAAALSATACGPRAGDAGGTESSEPAGAATPLREGAVAVLLTADGGEARDALFSFALPFAPGALRDEQAAAHIALLDDSGREVAIATRVLALWQRDRSVRSLLVLARASLDDGKRARYQLL